jgi:hypothetical protein
MISPLISPAAAFMDNLDGVPDNVIGLLAVVVIQLCGVAVLVVQARLQRTHNKELGEVKTQVTNGHTTNLRDDVDGLKADVAGLSQRMDGLSDTLLDVAEHVGEMRGELRAVRNLG